MSLTTDEIAFLNKIEQNKINIEKHLKDIEHLI